MVLLWLGLAPSTTTDQEKLGRGLSRLMERDPALAARTGAAGDVQVGAVSEEHLDAVVNQLVHEFDVEAAIFSHYAPAILSEDDGDREANVRSPVTPRRPPRILSAAVPEPPPDRFD